MHFLILPVMRLVVPLLSFYEDGFGIFSSEDGYAIKQRNQTKPMIITVLIRVDEQDIMRDSLGVFTNMWFSEIVICVFETQA